jgi:hypothetical protein
MVDAPHARELIDDALTWVASLEGLERLIGCCGNLAAADASGLATLIGRIRDGLDLTLTQAYRSLNP